ncbi:MAG: PAS domain-containing protein [Methyloceanibacter sp.]
MQQATCRELYAYWDRVRNGRVAPYRYEIEPARIATLLPETFIAEPMGLSGFRFRLAGTRICEQIGRELRGIDFLTLWDPRDREAIASLIRNIFSDGAVGHGRFRVYTHTNRQADFEFVFLPLIHSDTTIDRLLGAITAIDAPFWLGAESLERQELIELHGHRPYEASVLTDRGGAEIVRLVRGRFRVYEGGASRESDEPAGGRTRFVPNR